MHAQAQPLALGVLQQRQRLGLAARNGHATAIPVIVQVVERAFSQLKSAFSKLVSIAQREAELQQVEAANANAVDARKHGLHLRQRARDHGHLHHHVRHGGNCSGHALEHRRIDACHVIGLDAKAQLIKPRLRQRGQTLVVKQIAARVQAHVHAREQLLRPCYERNHLVLVQQRFTARYRQTIKTRPGSMRLLKLGNDIALVRQKVLVVVLIGVEAEVTLSRAAQVNEKRGRALARAACHARRRDPPTPQRPAAVLAASPACAGHARPLAARARLACLERNAERRNRFLVIALNLVKRLRIFANVHVTPLSTIKR